MNLSVRNLLDRDLLHRSHSLIREHGAAEHVVLEVTETAVVHDVGEAAQALERFRALGCRISLDDFGTGYSSLTQVSQLPVDELKIDRMLVRDIDTNDRNHALVETIIALGHRLGLTVVAEGIETAQNLQTVQALGCDLGQGYFLSRPVAASAIAQLLQVPRLPAAAEPAEDRAS